FRQVPLYALLVVLEIRPGPLDQLSVLIPFPFGVLQTVPQALQVFEDGRSGLRFRAVGGSPSGLPVRFVGHGLSSLGGPVSSPRKSNAGGAGNGGAVPERSGTARARKSSDGPTAVSRSGGAKAMAEEKIIGIDLGTTNSVVAVRSE